MSSSKLSVLSSCLPSRSERRLEKFFLLFHRRISAQNEILRKKILRRCPQKDIHFLLCRIILKPKKELNMISRRFSDGIPILGIGILGYIHEFVISIKPEILPTLLFSLLIVKGIAILFAKKEK